MKTIFTIEGQVIRAALLCAAKNDARYYLNGVMVNTIDNVLVGTNGHVLYKNEIYVERECNSEKEYILESFKVPMSVLEVVITIEDDANVALVTMYDKKKNKSMIEVNLIDGRFPDYKRALPAPTDKAEISECGFTGEYLSLVDKVFPKSVVRFDFKSNSRVIVQAQIYSNKEYIINRDRGMLLVANANIK